MLFSGSLKRCWQTDREKQRERDRETERESEIYDLRVCNLKADGTWFDEGSCGSGFRLTGSGYVPRIWILPPQKTLLHQNFSQYTISITGSDRKHPDPQPRVWWRKLPLLRLRSMRAVSRDIYYAKYYGRGGGLDNEQGKYMGLGGKKWRKGGKGKNRAKERRNPRQIFCPCGCKIDFSMSEGWK